MKHLLDLSNEDARTHLLKGSSCFSADMPAYISFEPILQDVASVLDGNRFAGFVGPDKPKDFAGVNYALLSNKDGRFAWRPLELIHPVLYVSLVNTLCDPANWVCTQERFAEFENGVVDCCSIPVVSVDGQSDAASQVKRWWQRIEQRSIAYSLEFSHILHADVTDCYGSLYTHSIAWALHGKEHAKQNQRDNSLFGNEIDSHVQVGRYGQTNGIAQGSVLMDLLAEVVLGYVDQLITSSLSDSKDCRILRYRDDYRIFANSDDSAENVLMKISDCLRTVGMKLDHRKLF